MLTDPVLPKLIVQTDQHTLWCTDSNQTKELEGVLCPTSDGWGIHMHIPYRI